jgi:hypothetical protein
MAYGGKIDWRGCDDGTPSSSTKHDLRDAPEPPRPKGGDWRGMDDGTPASRPTAPDKD